MMGRIIMVVTVWLVMAAMLLVIALPVIADNSGEQKGPGNQGPPDFSGEGNRGTSSVVRHNNEGACVFHRGETTGTTTGGGCEETTD
jgi:hypothetical protein